MRVSKVKVENKMVLMHRTNEEGALIIENSADNKTKEILPEKKMENFYKSVINKTLVKDIKYIDKDKKTRTKPRDKYIEFTLTNLIEKGKAYPLNNKDIETIQENLSEKFKKDFSYNGNKPFNLADLIYKYSKNNDIKILQPYKDWVEWYIETKCKFLIKSIENNRIVIENGEEKLSKRKKVLIGYEEDLKNYGEIDLSDVAKIFDITSLVREILPKVEEYIEKDKKRTYKDKNNNKLERELNFAIKKVLQIHQQKIFGTRDTPKNRDNDKLSIYNLEVVKYIEHYFPIKKSLRTYTPNTIIHHLKVLTIRSTIQHQIENAVRLNMIHLGKTIHHGYDNSVSSTDFSNTKRQEAFVLNTIGACAFAANNIRNIVDRELDEDILGKRALGDCIQKNIVDYDLFKMFYGKDYNSNKETLWAIRGSVQGIRNKVIHYKKDAIENIFNINDFEYPKIENKDNKSTYKQSAFKDYLHEDISNLSELFANQLMTGGVLSYYSIDNLKTILNEIKFDLCRSSMPFIPSFKKIFKRGCNYQVPDHYLKVENYLPKGNNNETEEEYQARYFLLKLIYNNIFISSFDGETFRVIAKLVLKENKNYASTKTNKDEYAFNDIREIKDDEEIIDYMSYVQSSIMQQQIIKDEKEFKTNTEQRNNFEKYLLDVFVKGFDVFIDNFNLKSIHKTEYQFDSALKNKDKADELKKKKEEITPYCKIKEGVIDEKESSHIAFYTFCKLLDANHLSNLRNEIIKYRQCSNNDFNLHHLLGIIELCLLKADNLTINNQEKIISDKEQVALFVEDKKELKEYGDLYIQLDEKTVVVHSSIELLNKYGTKQRLLNLVEKNPDFKVKHSEYIDWRNLKEKIENKVKEREELHKKWEKEDKLDTKEKERYKYLADKIDIYNWLDNKLHFVYLKKIHSLTIDILGRMAGFVTLFERDFQYLDKRLGTNLDFSKGLPKEKTIDVEYENLMLSDNYRDIRNYIAHFNYLSSKELNYSIIDLINELRELLSYDRKLKNAVSKSIIDIFDKNGMVLTLELDNDSKHILRLKDIKPKEIYHLGTKKGKYEIVTNQVQIEFCEICKSLLELKKEG